MSESPLRIVLVDDEPLARARARRLLLELPGVVVVGEAGSVEEAAPLIDALRPECVLLDVQMPGEDGFALLPRLTHRPAIVFATAYDQYAVKAFEENAVDYLLKPFRAERLAAAIERVRRELERPEELSKRLQELLASVGHAPQGDRLERFTVRIGQKQLIVRAADVLWFGAEDKLVFAAVEGDRHWIDFTLDELERQLDPATYLRVNRSTIVHSDPDPALCPAFAGTYRLQLDDAARTEVPVSRARARLLRERLGA